MNQPPQALPNGSLLFNGSYRIESCLGQGGFGITYSATDLTLQRTVAIKEFFPSGCGRNGARLALHGDITQANYAAFLRRFIEEGRVLARLHHPGIVPVYTLFQENDTAYLVMEHIAGETVRSYLASSGRRLPENEAVEIIRQAGEALKIVHAANLLHRDIKPANMVRRPDGHIVLIDFGAAREYLIDSEFSQSVVLTPGYAPLEQYTREGKREPYTDVYGLAATLYHLLTGQRPTEALARATGAELAAPHQLQVRVSARVSAIVMQGLALRSEERPQDIGLFLEALLAREQGPVTLTAAGTATGVWVSPGSARRPANPKLGDVRINPIDGAEMIWIPPGPFLMGDDDITGNRRRTVTLTGYWIYKNLVTVGMYKRYCQEKGKQMPREPEFTAGNKFNPGWSKEDNPIVDVSWNDIMGEDGYCVWAGVTLPTEAQWEKAARGAKGLKYPWGDTFDAGKAWCSKKAWGDAVGTTAVGRYGISPYGCTDMAGNVWQWCSDWYVGIDKNSPSADPGGPADGAHRVLRGGSWNFDVPDFFRPSYRIGLDPGLWFGDIGFRCASEL